MMMEGKVLKLTMTKGGSRRWHKIRIPQTQPLSKILKSNLMMMVVIMGIIKEGKIGWILHDDLFFKIT
jgi:hypothetical protein